MNKYENNLLIKPQISSLKKRQADKQIKNDDNKVNENRDLLYPEDSVAWNPICYEINEFYKSLNIDEDEDLTKEEDVKEDKSQGPILKPLDLKPQILQFKKRTILFNKSGEKGPDKPPPFDPEDYENVDPDNLEDVIFPNGDIVRFKFFRTLTDGKGRERKFYSGVYEYIDKRTGEKKNIDLSRFVPGKTTIFEGTKGAMTGGASDPNVKWAGWATSLQKEGYNLVALNLQLMQQNGLDGIITIFHELGHVYIFGNEKKIFGDKIEEKSKNFLEFLSNKFNKMFNVGDQARLIKVFHERYACAFSSKQIRRLGINIENDILEKRNNHTITFYSQYFNDLRFLKGNKNRS